MGDGAFDGCSFDAFSHLWRAHSRSSQAFDVPATGLRQHGGVRRDAWPRGDPSFDAHLPYSLVCEDASFSFAVQLHRRDLHCCSYDARVDSYEMTSQHWVQRCRWRHLGLHFSPQALLVLEPLMATLAVHTASKAKSPLGQNKWQ